MDWVILNLAVFGAAAVQAATGIGFGALAGPILLLTLGSAAAVQITIVLSLLIALVLAPSLRREADGLVLRHLLVGSVLGLPIGIVIYLNADVALLELLAGVAVLGMAISVLAAGRPRADQDPARGPSERPARGGTLAVGVLSGLMSTSLAMPGPPVAAWMAGRNFSKTAIRSTVLTLFVPSYAAAAILQACVATTTLETLSIMAKLTPATLVGLLCGRALTSRISDLAFRRIVLFLLWATALGLLISGARRALG